MIIDNPLIITLQPGLCGDIFDLLLSGKMQKETKFEVFLYFEVFCILLPWLSSIYGRMKYWASIHNYFTLSVINLTKSKSHSLILNLDSTNSFIKVG